MQQLQRHKFNICPEDIHIPLEYPVLAIPLSASGSRESRPSLDRFIPANGYVIGNIRVISFRANRIKSDATLEEMRRVLSYMEGVL